MTIAILNLNVNFYKLKIEIAIEIAIEIVIELFFIIYHF